MNSKTQSTPKYKELGRSSRRSKFSFGCRYVWQYLFAFTMLLTIVFLTLYEFYFTVVEKSKNGTTEPGILEAIVCQVFMLTACPPKNNSALIQLRETVQQINKAQVIRNFEGHEVKDDTIIVVIQVHNRGIYLKEVIESLKAVKDIDSAVLVFSHDFFCEEINALVHAIDFAPVMQMFFPFNIQLYPNEFPGTDPRDCPTDMDVERARRIECLGAKTPDSYNHFRNGHVTQTKHHWWWKINRVFDHLIITNNFDGYVLFLEEDHYVAPDILHTLRLMIELANNQCPQCNKFSLGNTKKPQSCKDNADKVDVINGNNMGFAFNRSLWNSLSACASVFCTFDDYNWDWSLRFTAQECFFQKITSLVVRCSRVFHIGDCGLHHNIGDCDSNESLREAKDLIDSAKSFLFPKTLSMESVNLNQNQLTKGYGGWADPRDIEMCINMSSQRTVLSNS